MARAADPQAAELRRVIDQQITNLETAIAISEKASQVDAAAPDGDPFAAVSAGDVIQVIADARVAGKINDYVIYLLARFPTHELIERSNKAKKRRQARTKKELDGRFDSTEDRRGKAVRRFQELRKTYPGWKVKAINAEVAKHFGVSARTIGNWVSSAKNVHSAQ